MTARISSSLCLVGDSSCTAGKTTLVEVYLFSFCKLSSVIFPSALLKSEVTRSGSVMVM